MFKNFDVFRCVRCLTCRRVAVKADAVAQEPRPRVCSRHLLRLLVLPSSDARPVDSDLARFRQRPSLEDLPLRRARARPQAPVGAQVDRSALSQALPLRSRRWRSRRRLYELESDVQPQLVHVLRCGCFACGRRALQLTSFLPQALSLLLRGAATRFPSTGPLGRSSFDTPLDWCVSLSSTRAGMLTCSAHSSFS